jgi:quinoprotein glucose dehydrogenase
MPALADLLAELESAETALVRRVLNANYRLGGEERARALAGFAARADAETAHRVEALEMLAEWTDPPPLDRVLGHWDPLAPRDGVFLASLPALVAEGIEQAPDDVCRAFVALVVASEDRSSLPRLARWITDGLGAGRVRAQALEALETLDWPELLPLVDAALADADGAVRATALELLERRSPAEVLSRLPTILAHGELAERRVAYVLLATNDDPRARTLLLHELELLAADLVPAELAFDVVRAAEAQDDPALNHLLAARRARRDRDPELAPWLDTLFGGDRDRGHTVFERVDLSCVRCHAIRPERGLRVGPNLEGVGERLSRLQLLESLVAPNRRTTPGYRATVFFLADGSVVSGRVVEESEGRVSVQDADGALIELSEDEIAERRADLSAMPEDLAKDLSLEEMRDLIAYLAGL